MLKHRRLSGPAWLGTTTTTLCTAAEGATLLVREMILHNSGAAPATYSLHLVPSGSAPGGDNRIFHGPLEPGETAMVSLGGSGLVLAEGDSLCALADTADSIVASIHGAEVS